MSVDSRFYRQSCLLTDFKENLSVESRDGGTNLSVDSRFYKVNLSVDSGDGGTNLSVDSRFNKEMCLLTADFTVKLVC